MQESKINHSKLQHAKRCHWKTYNKEKEGEGPHAKRQRNQKRSTCVSDNMLLKQTITDILKRCQNEGKLKLSEKRKNAFIDCIASNNLIDDKSYSSRKVIQDGYVQEESQVAARLSRIKSTGLYVICVKW